jgi:peptidoglycan/xylan/chitin deacetylase (PgdA/CDA1 family)
VTPPAAAPPSEPSGSADAPGVFVLSLDTELAWGTFDAGGLTRYAGHYDQYRVVVSRTLELLERYQVPATWAFVGHLMLEGCARGADGHVHPEVLRPRYRWYPHEWHHLDPGTDMARDPWWYAPDLLERVLRAPVVHEVATHTFSHIVADDPACTREIFLSQMHACARLHEAWGVPMRSIVYPRNRVAFRDELPGLGIVAYRGRERRWYTDAPATVSRGAHLLDAVLAPTPSTYPLGELVEGELVNVPASMFLLPFDGVRRLIPAASRTAQALRGVRRAAARGELFHLWLHPVNLASDPRMFTVLERVLREAAELRERGRMRTLTMEQTARLVRGEEVRRCAA